MAFGAICTHECEKGQFDTGPDDDGPVHPAPVCVLFAKAKVAIASVTWTGRRMDEGRSSVNVPER